jgi:DNA polymerase I-like protein with 3'-5' exonuclease and polymerase domains
MDPDNTQWYDRFIDDCFREDEDRRDDFEEPWHWSCTSVSYRILEITKSLGMISEGVNAWLKLSTNHRLHHHCSVATSTHRCAHRNPNLAQVPSDERFRRLFLPTPGQVMVGADLSLALSFACWHTISPVRRGQIRRHLLNGDIHQANADKIGITSKAC